MTFLAFDCETTGLYVDHLGPADPLQPYIVKLAALLCDDDGKGLEGFCVIVKPADGIYITREVSALHGVTNEIADKYGITNEQAVDWFGHLYRLADACVAHNIEFDCKVMETALARRYNKLLKLRKPLFCTKELSTTIVNLPPTKKMIKAGFHKPKSPTLGEAIRFFFNEEINAHDALADVSACARLYFHLKGLGHVEAKA